MTVPVPGQLVYSSNADGVTTVFPYPVRFLEGGELVVIHEHADGSQTKLVYNVDYTVSGVDTTNGGSVTLTFVPTEGKIIRYRDTTAKQIVDLKDAQRNPAEAVERQLDRLAMVDQDYGRRLGSIEIQAGAIDEAVRRSEQAMVIAEDAAAEAVEAASAAEVAEAGAEAARDEAGNLVQSIGPASGTVYALGGAVQSIDTATPGLEEIDVDLFIGGVKQRFDSYLIDAAGVITPVGGTWPGDGVTPNAELLISTTTHISTPAAVGTWITPEQYGAAGDGIADDTSKLSTALTNALMQKKPLRLADSKTYRITQLTIPANSVIIGTGKLRLAGALTGSNVDLTVGDGCKIERLRISTPGTETNTNFLSLGANVEVGYLEAIADTQRALGGVICPTGSNLRLGYLKARKIDTPIWLGTTSLSSQGKGSNIGFIDVESYQLGFRANFCSFSVGGLRAVGRSPNASKSPGHNGVLVEGCQDWSFGDLWIEDAGEHAFRIGGSRQSHHSPTENYKIGVITAIRCGGCALKINPTLLVSAGVTEKAYQGAVAGVLGVDVGDGLLAGNSELLRLSHIDNLNIGFALAYAAGAVTSAQYGLQINDAVGVTIGTLGGESINAGLINIDGASDTDGINQFGGDVSSLRVDRLIGICNGSNAIGVNTTFNVGRVYIGLDGARGWTTNLLRWIAGTLTQTFELRGRVEGAPTLSDVPVSDQFLVDISYQNTSRRGRGASVRGASVMELAGALFNSGAAPGSFGLYLNAFQGTAGNGNYGASVEFSRIGVTRRGGAIALKQTGGNQEDTGIAILTGHTTPASDQVNEALVIKHYRRLNQTGLTTYADNTAALAGGLAVGDFYSTATGELRIVF